MSKIDFKPGNMLYPVPAVMVSCGICGMETNIITIAWAGTVCSDPPMVSISVRPERYSYHIIKETGEFVINLVPEELTAAMDTCGVRSGRDCNKWELCHLTQAPAAVVKCPVIGEAPVQIECRVQEEIALGSHSMFLARVEAVHVDERYMDEKGKLDLEAARLVSYSHGIYHAPGKRLGTFGFSVRKKKQSGKQTIRKANSRKSLKKVQKRNSGDGNRRSKEL